MKTFMALLFLALSISASADYLVTNRKTSVKTEPSSSSSALIQIEIDVTLILLDEQQTNGYYRVMGAGFSIGWIYRTFVRRYVGDAPTWIPGLTENVEVRILDVGNGQCNVIKLPGEKFVIYDAGHWQNFGKRTLAQIQEVIPAGSTIELMVLSHTDADHIGAAENIMRAYKVKKVLWTGYERSMISAEESTDSFKRFKAVLDAPPYPFENINLNERDSTIIPGTKLQFGDASLIFLCGFGKPQTDWSLKDNSERLNAVSIVMKLEFKGNSILFCGDAVGRHLNDPENALLGTEKFLIDNAFDLLSSTVLIAPHHGANNASSPAFVQNVKPKYVIFSAGHMYQHPTKAAADRYLAGGVNAGNMFRTDRGDDEFALGKSYLEWSYLKVDGCSDGYGDDDVEMVLGWRGDTLAIRYLHENEVCIAAQ